MPDLNGKAPEKGYLEKNHGSEKKRPFFPISSRLVLPRIFYLQVCSASLWQNTPMQRTVCFPRFIMDETIPGLKNTVCMLVKTLPVYCKFDPKTTVQAYMAELSEQMLSSMANDIFPFSDICAKYGLNSDLTFAYQAELSDDYPIGDTIARGHDLSLDMAKMPLLIQVREYNHTYVLTAEYRSDMYSQAFIDGILIPMKLP